MIKTSVTIQAKQDFLRGLHSESDVYKLALYGFKASLGPESDVYSLKNEVTGEGYETGGKILDGHSVTNDGGAAILSFKSPTWVNASFTARGAVIYNSSKGNKILATFDFEKDISPTNGTFIATIPPATKEEGLITFD